MSSRLSFPRAELRRRTVRGAVVTAAFLVGIDGLVVLQGLVVTRLLGPAEIGLYGIVSTALVTVLALKRVGIDEAFVQRETEAVGDEFRHAFTLELALAGLASLALCALAPVLAAAYGQPRLLGLTLGVAWLPLAFALLAPLWVFFRRMDFARQRSLQAIQPVVTFAVTVPLAAWTGLGVWSIVIGLAAGYAVAVVVALVTSPYRLGLRFDRDVAGRYLRFSGWVFVALVAAMVVVQGQVVSFAADGGLAAVGFITLATTLTRYVDRADQIVTATIYPAVCAIQGRTAALEELFVTSNRATLLYAAPFGVGVVLFAPDLVAFALGRAWDPAVELLQGLAVAGLLTQLGFNWFSFYRAHGDPRPPAIEAIVAGVAFLALAVPGLALWGVDGFVAGRVAAVVLALAWRARYVRALLPGVRLGQLVGGALPPLLAAAGVVVVLRVALWGGLRPLGQALVEAGLFCAVFGALAMRRERALLAELRGSFGGAGAGEQGAGQDEGDERQPGHLPVPVDGGVQRPDDERGGGPGG
ncbi:MAG: oligosaccharide flippase family protein [Actinomycetota bacterium]|nr:oligosaccharide flippase family protein [Actinomycetota bacterium]